MKMARRFVDDTQKVARDPNSKLQVIAAGQWRAATSTLQYVFETQLDPPLTPSMHGAYIAAYNSRLKLCVTLCYERSKQKRQTLLKQLYGGYNACSDYPAFAFLDDLLEIYPDAKVILNLRQSPEAWEQSVQGSLAVYRTFWYHLSTYLVPQSYWHYKLYRSFGHLCESRFGRSDYFTKEFYEIQNQWVRDVAKAHDRPLLEWNPSMGVEPLLQFLGRDVNTDVGLALPRINESSTLAELERFLFRRGWKAWAYWLSPLIAVMIAFLIFQKRWNSRQLIKTL